MPDGAEEAKSLLRYCLNKFELKYCFNNAVKRGLTYYVEDGFEVECDKLGSQKQIAGGGRYTEGNRLGYWCRSVNAGFLIQPSMVGVAELV